MRVTLALRQILGKYCLLQHAESRLARWVLKIGHRLKMMILIASSGEGQLRAFMEPTTLLTSSNVGAWEEWTKGVEGAFFSGIQSGLKKTRLGFFSA